MEHRTAPQLPSLLAAARGLAPADIVFSNALLFDPFTCEWKETDFAVSHGRVAGLGEYHGQKTIDLQGKRVIPGLIDAHVHIESSLLSPTEYARLVSSHGTTTVVADPHEIANVSGKEGIEFMLRERTGLPVDILLMLPSCVPATPMDRGGAVLTADDLRPFLARDGVLGLGEVMNVPGVLNGDPGVMEKIALFPIVDGHAPLLSGKDLSAYLAMGIQSDHESTSLPEAAEKLSLGMYLYLREGSTEKNLSDLIPLANDRTSPFLSFATDDRHADMLASMGHIDDCIRKAVACGLEPEIAIRMATLSPAGRFRLSDRGAVAPGRLADFCVLREGKQFSVERTYKSGRPGDEFERKSPGRIRSPMECRLPGTRDLSIKGEGKARVIGLLPHQILTSSLEFDVQGEELPDPGRDILKVVVCNRYRPGTPGIGLVHGFGMQEGALAASVSHDAHNLVAVGADDRSLLSALSEVIRAGGGMAVAKGDDTLLLPLECAGLMSVLPAEEVSRRLLFLNRRAGELGSIEEPFMYLSFLALTVIPHLRITDRGLFDVDAFCDVPLFL
ncbi:MAG: adenine deaminase [Methanolinea sp.]|nr:adenine deaminase [Methanolinea sp.]